MSTVTVHHLNNIVIFTLEKGAQLGILPYHTITTVTQVIVVWAFHLYVH